MLHQEAKMFTARSEDDALIVEEERFGVVLDFESVVALMASVERFERRFGAEDGPHGRHHQVDGRQRPAEEQTVAVALLPGECLHLGPTHIFLQLD